MRRQLLWRWPRTAEILAGAVGILSCASASAAGNDCECPGTAGQDGFQEAKAGEVAAPSPAPASAAALSEVCPVAQEVVFLVAASGLSTRNADRLRDFLRALLLRLPRPPVRTGLVTFGEEAKVLATLQGNSSEVLKRLDDLAPEPGESLLAPALRRAAVMLAASTASAATQVVLIMAAPPNDLQSEGRARAAELRTSGARLTVLWLGYDGRPPEAVEALASAPASANVLPVPGYAALGSSVVSASKMVREPCPCPGGVTSEMPGPDGLVAAMGPSYTLQPGGSETQDCAAYFPDYSGTVMLVCSDGALRAISACRLTCPAGRAAVVDVHGVRDHVAAPRAVPAGAVVEMACEEVIPGARGVVSFTCRDGLLLASHDCALGCAVGGGPTVAEWHGEPLLLPGFPAVGLAHGNWTTAPCPEHFGGPEAGELGVLCAAGRLQTFGACAAAAPCEEAEDIPSGWSLSSHVVAGVGLTIMLTGVVLAAWVLWIRRRETKVIAPYKLEAVVRKFVSLGLQVDDVGPPPKAIGTRNTQCPPQIYAEFVRGSQRPLDIVFCIDSSFSVGPENFQKSVRFLEHVVQDLQMPRIKVGVIRFHHSYSVVSPMTGDRDKLLACLQGMAYEPGETELAGPLSEAAYMLKIRGASGASMGPDDDACMNRKKAVVIVSDGDPRDLVEARREAEALKSREVLLLFVQVGRLAAPGVAQSMSSSGPGGDMVIQLGGYDELPSASDSVLQRILEVSKWVRRAKCIVNWSAYEPVAELDAIPGYDAVIPGWEPAGHDAWTWDSDSGKRIVDPEALVWNPSLARVREPSGPRHANEAVQAVCLESDKGIQTDVWEDVEPERRTGTHAGVQTEAVVKVLLEPWRQAQMDFVVCLDSGCGRRDERLLGSCEEGASPVGCGCGSTLRKAKFLVDHMVSHLQSPEVQMALVRFQQAHEVVCEFTADLTDFQSRLRAVEPEGQAPAEGAFAPSLWQALAMLGGRSQQASRNQPADAPAAPVTRVVLVVTDREPQDVDEAREAAQALREHRVRLVFVRLLPRGRACPQCSFGCLQTLAALSWHPPRLDSAAFPEGVFETEESEEALQAVVPRILRQLVRVTQRVARARVALPLELPVAPEAEIAEGDTDGHAILLDPASRCERADRTDWAPLTQVQAAELAAEKQAETLDRGLRERLQRAEARKAALMAELDAVRLASPAAVRREQSLERAAQRRADEASRQAESARREADLKVCAAKRQTQDAEARVARAKERIRVAEGQARGASDARAGSPEPPGGRGDGRSDARSDARSDVRSDARSARSAGSR